MNVKPNRELQEQCINTIRILSADAVQKPLSSRHAVGRRRDGLPAVDAVSQAQP